MSHAILLVTGCTLLAVGACSRGNVGGPAEDASGAPPGVAKDGPRVLEEGVERVYNSEWSSFDSTRRYAFFSWRARVRGGAQDCYARVDGMVTDNQFVPAHRERQLLKVWRVGLENADQVARRSVRWRWFCGSDLTREMRPMGSLSKVTVGQAEADAAYSSIAVLLTTKFGDETCIVVVAVYALNERGMPLDTSTGRFTLAGDTQTVVHVRRSSHQAGRLSDYQPMIRSHVARIFRVDCL